MATIKYIVVDDGKLLSMFNKFDTRQAEYMRIALIESMHQVGIFAVGQFMKPTPRPGGSKLGIDTTRLSRSLLDGFFFGGFNPGTREAIRDIVFRGNQGIATYGTEVPYAAIHEYGGKTPPHTITPKTTKVLAWESGGEMHFAKSVSHPGSTFPATPFLNPGLQAARPAIDGVFRNQFGALVEEINRG